MYDLTNINNFIMGNFERKDESFSDSAMWEDEENDSRLTDDDRYWQNVDDTYTQHAESNRGEVHPNV